MQPTRVRLHRHESPQMQFELAFAPPAEGIRTYVREYVGWVARSSVLVCRRELPSGDVPLIINFGSTVRERKAASDEWREHGTFTAGLHDAFTLVTSGGPSFGMQINFTAIGARLFYDRPLSDLTNTSVDLADVLGASASLLVARLHDTASWGARFDLLDREIATRIAAARQLARPIAWAWQALVQTAGRARVGDLVREIGWSERYFAAQFRDHVGLPPKVFARVLRFRHAVRLLTGPQRGTLADVSQACGYFDQAHFTRDFTAFAGITPSALLASRLPEHSGYRADTKERART